jgi:SHS2 domain-containing protein
MSYQILEDVSLADVAVEIRAATLEEIFREAAEAMLAVQLERADLVGSTVHRTVILSKQALDILLYGFLQELVYLKDAQRLFLRVASATVAEADKTWTLTAELAGDISVPERHRPSVDVKATTLNDLSFEHTAGKWRAHFVLDI